MCVAKQVGMPGSYDSGRMSRILVGVLVRSARNVRDVSNVKYAQRRAPTSVRLESRSKKWQRLLQAW